MKFVHAADLHVDSPLRGLERYETAPVERIRLATRQALENLVTCCLEEQADFLVLAGDLFDHDWPDFNTPLFVIGQLQRLIREGIHIFIVFGNHDAQEQISRRAPWPRKLCHVFDTGRPQTVQHTFGGLPVAIHGVSLRTRREERNFVPQFPPPVPASLNVGILHTSAVESAHEKYAPCTIEELLAKGYDYWALGHVHQFRHECDLTGTRHVVYPGNPQCRHVNEIDPAGPMKGCVVVEVHDGHIQEDHIRRAPTDVLRWFRKTVHLEPADTLEDLGDKAALHFQEAVREAEGRLAAVRLVFRGTTNLHAELHQHHLRGEVLAALRARAAEVSDDLWLERVQFQTVPMLDLAALRRGDDLLGQLLRQIEDLQQQPQRLAELADLPELRSLGNKLAHAQDADGRPLRVEDPQRLARWTAQAQEILLRALAEEAA